jgi:hypothetical protein
MQDIVALFSLHKISSPAVRCQGNVAEIIPLTSNVPVRLFLRHHHLMVLLNSIELFKFVLKFYKKKGCFT